jgi:hypothetical protein
MSTNAYPMDLDSLQKGQLITVKELEFILAVNPQKKEAFEFAVMGLQALIHSRTELTAMIAKDGLRILTDEQASIHNGRERDNAIQKARRRQRKLTQVDVSNLSESRRNAHDISILNGGRIIQAIDQEVQKIQCGSSRNHHEQYMAQLRSKSLELEGPATEEIQ